ncbi:hypothetical protein ACFEMC_10570 [Kineococcus sp. DHX-1]|uniref:hypothetical protein n=1 Tax=Kineococcus sp. DHX-1 TaxID=3349638 RepID=UPI0036D3A03D
MGDWWIWLIAIPVGLLLGNFWYWFVVKTTKDDVSRYVKWRDARRQARGQD